MVLSGLKIHLNLVKISYKTTMKTAMKDVLLKFMFNILKEQKLEYWETCMIKKEYAVHIRSFKQALNRISIEKKV